MGIDKKSPIPAYYQIKEDIRSKINQGIWKAGEAIDSERKISEDYEVSRMTVRQAIGELEREGILTREKGRGTFVRTPKVTQHDIMSFTEMAKKNGLKVKTVVLSFDKVPTPDRFSHDIEDTYIYTITRLRYIEDEPVGIETVYIPINMLGDDVKREDLSGSLFDILNERGYSIDNSEATIQAVLMNKKYMEIFGASQNIPLVKICSRYISGKHVFLEESVYNSNKYVLKIQISKKELRLN